MSKNLSIGKMRGLQQCSTAKGAIAVMALDHRNNLRNALNPSSPQSVSDEDLTAFKIQVVSALAPVATAVLLDPEVGGAQCIASGALPGSTGLLLAVEATGYTGDPNARASQVLPGWSAAKAARMGATAIKLLVYYHPEAKVAKDIEELTRQVAEDCAAQDLPLFIEPLSYSPDPARKKLSPEERQQVVLETARRLTAIPGVDILKAEFPLDAQAETRPEAWEKACRELSEASQAPWVLLSASVPFEVYLKQVTIALQAGSSGVAVGRAVWQEASQLIGAERVHFLQHDARDRMERMTALCDALATPWTDFYTAPPVDSTWYQSYQAPDQYQGK